MHEPTSRRSFLRSATFAAAALGTASAAKAAEVPKIQGFEEEKADPQAAKQWKPVSDRRIRMGIVGYGACKFGAQFSLQHHPNVEVVAVSDLFPDRCRALAEICKCEKTYPSLEEMVKDDSIEAIFCATDAPSHCRHAIEVLKHGKHVASAVPAVFGSLEEADQLYEAVKASGFNYMLFETSCYHADLYAMREIYAAGGFGKLVYSEGEYFHYSASGIASYKDWRVGLPPQWYPTHSNAYYVGVTGGSFTEVSCMGMPSLVERLQPNNNRYKNPFGTEIALFHTSEGGMARMGVSWDTPGYGGEVGRVRGQKGSMIGMDYEGLEKKLPSLEKPALPPSVEAGGHGGSHGYLGHEFAMSILERRKPLVDVAWALNMTVAGVVAHQSALKDGELMKIPQYTLD
ncbi:MAG TPA: Gfo/Idh/MocA family oxidoreductase [Thermoguttaceae bacterium]|nr:Gfo/Idh/MocA family oxidoreductase [Thermoguttaceae bacterium]